MKTGLSVSFCIADILAGTVAESAVAWVVAGTCVRDGDWSKVIASYRRNYWYANPDEGEAILRRWIAAGIIDQPRVRGELPPQIWDGTHWREESPDAE